MALPPSTANWHWKNKNVSRWGQDWFKRELPTIVIVGDSEVERVSISRVNYVEGDVELGQRKSKYTTALRFFSLWKCLTTSLLTRLITIYDCKVDLEWSGTASDGTEVSGKLEIPEVSHEITLDGLSDYTVRHSCLLVISHLRTDAHGFPS